jgi:hypothetical protein
MSHMTTFGIFYMYSLDFLLDYISYHILLMLLNAYVVKIYILPMHRGVSLIKSCLLSLFLICFFLSRGSPTGGVFCDTPGVCSVLRREIYPNLRCSVKISICHSRMSLIIQTIRTHFTEFGIIQSHKRPNLEPVKNFYSRRECKLVNQSRFINLV